MPYSRRAWRQTKYRLQRTLQQLSPIEIKYRPYKSYRRRSHTRLPQVLAFLATIFFFLFLSGIVGTAGVVAYFSRDLPSPYKLTNRDIEQSTKIYDRNGKLLYDIYGDVNRTMVELDEVPPSLIQATLAVEDSEFYVHQGLSLTGIVRSAILNLTRQGLYGGSTLTQQVVKNSLLTSERTITRKIKEAVLTMQVEKRYSKDEILKMYLNEVPYGGTAYGVQAASQLYFGKDVKDLTLAESALLAGLPQSPTNYSPFGAYPENAKARQETVLKLMYEKGWKDKDGSLQKLTEAQYNEALTAELHYASGKTQILAPHFVLYVKSLLEEKYGPKLVEQGGLRVTTTLDYELQKMAEEEVRFQIDRLAQANANARNGALVSIDPRTGEVLAMVGSVDYFDTTNDGNVNVALAERQPGSSIKPIMYATAFEKGYTAATFLSDIRTTWSDGAGGYTPKESDGIYWGPMLLRDALANSRNVPAVKMMQLVGVQAVVDMAHKMGITSLNEPERYGLSLTLGGGEVKLLEHTSAFGTFANKGVHQPQVSILKVEDSKGKVLEEFKAGSGNKVLEESVAYLVTDILADNQARQRLFGAGNLLQIKDWRMAVKTGTTDDGRDAWTVGYTPNMVTGVWVGNNNNEPTNGIQGSTGATPIWHYFMERVLANRDRGEFVKPEASFVSRQIDTLSGMLPGDGTEGTRWEIFIKGTEPNEEDNFHTKVKVCKDQGLLATEIDEKLGNVEEKTFKQLIEINSGWQKYTDEWMKAVGGYSKPPTQKCDSYKNITEPVVIIKSPKDNQTVKKDFNVTVDVISPNTITKVEFYYDDVLYKSISIVPYSVDFHLASDVLGSHEILVKAYDSKGEAGQAKITVKVTANNNANGPEITPSADD